MTIIQGKEIDIEWTLELCRRKTGLKQHEMAKVLGVSLDS